MSDTDELRNRIESKKHEIQKKIADYKADSSSEKRERIETLQGRLEELEKHVSDGWNDISESVAGKLNEWLKDDEKEDAA